MSKLRDLLLKIHKDNYHQNLKLIKQSLGPTSKYITKYANDYNKHLTKYESISTPAELFKKVSSSHVTYHGDYHTLKQSQKSILRVLKEVSKKRKLILCLEMFYGSDQKYIDQFMAKKISEKEFLLKIDYNRKWGYNWLHWKPVIQFCKTHKIQIIGINSDQSTEENPIKARDVYSAKIIGKVIIQNLDKLIYVVDGDYHICPKHLPLEVQKKLNIFDISIKRTIIYQNSANLYWQLANEEKEDEDVIKINSDSFCVMNAIPTNKLQSYLNWLEFTEDAFFPARFKWDEIQNPDRYSVSNILKTLCSFLDLPFPKKDFKHLSIYYPDNLNFMKVVQEHPVLNKLMKSIKNKIKRNEGFLLEYTENSINKYLIYLANSNLKMTAEESAHFLNASLRGILTQKLSGFDAFYRNIITESLGFYGSKLIVPKRKSNSSVWLRKFIFENKNKKLPKQLEEKLFIARLLLQHRYLEKKQGDNQAFQKKFNFLYKNNHHLNNIVSTQLGYMLGNKLYIAVKKGRFPFSQIQSLFSMPLNKPLEAFNLYLSLLKTVTKMNIKK